MAFLENVLCLLAYFISDAYQVFMTPATIFGGAGGVARDFLQLVLSLLARNLWRIGLVLLPRPRMPCFAAVKKPAGSADVFWPPWGRGCTCWASAR